MFNKSLGAAIEELFQNMTLSLFGDSRFVRDVQDPVDVTISYTRNLYSYSKKNLIVSYGVALSLALLASLAGCVAIFSKGASSTQKFSTVMMTMTGLGQVVAENDWTGADPCRGRVWILGGLGRRRWRCRGCWRGALRLVRREIGGKSLGLCIRGVCLMKDEL
jgi:hypothetical protein